MGEVQVRRLREPDLVAYKALRDAALTAEPQAFTSDAEAESAKTAESYARRAGLAQPASQRVPVTIGAFEADALVGAVSLERDERRKVQHIVHLVGMMVAPTHRRHGLGRALLRAALAEARATPGIALVTLSVTTDNLAAVALYEAEGFRRYGRLPDAIRLDGRSLGKDLMVLTLVSPTP